MFFSLLLLLLLLCLILYMTLLPGPLPTPKHISCVSLLCLCASLGFFLSIHNPWILCCVLAFLIIAVSALVCCVWFPADHWRRRRAAAHNQKRARESLHWFEVMTKLMDSWNHDVKKQLVNGIYASSLSLCLAHFLIFSPLFHRVSCEMVDLHTLDWWWLDCWRFSSLHMCHGYHISLSLSI